MSFNAVCYFEFIRFLQVGLKKSSSNLKLHQAALNISLSQWNRLNYGTSKFATLVFLIVGCTHFSIINVFRLFLQMCVSFKIQVPALALHALDSSSSVCVFWLHMGPDSSEELGWGVGGVFLSVCCFLKADATEDRQVMAYILKRKQTWFPSQRSCCFVTAVLCHSARVQ